MTTILRPTPKPSNRWSQSVDTILLREIVEKSGVPLSVIAARLDWWDHVERDTKVIPDVHRVKRRLGLAKQWNAWKKEMTYSTRVRQKTAVAILDAIGIDPWEVGL